MEVVSRLSCLKGKRSPIVMAAGFFDGVHIGHQRVIRQAVRTAHKAGGKTWILTFANHPLSVLRPDLAPRLLTTVEQKIELFRSCDVDGCLVLPFTKRLANRPAIIFIDELIESIPSLKRIYVGKNWRFGKGGEGTPALMQEECKKAGVALTVVDSVTSKEAMVSSTMIRSLVAEGDMPGAAKLLGRDYSVRGKVIKGRTVGRTMGYPTANLNPANDMTFPSGVYAAQAVIGERGRKRYNGVLNYGVRPTYGSGPGNKGVSLELHMFDVHRDLYGKSIEVFLKARIRGEEKFSSQEKLRQQIAEDVKIAGKLL